MIFHQEALRPYIVASHLVPLASCFFQDVASARACGHVGAAIVLSTCPQEKHKTTKRILFTSRGINSSLEMVSWSDEAR